jgi:hypothetical protein
MSSWRSLKSVGCCAASQACRLVRRRPRCGGLTFRLLLDFRVVCEGLRRPSPLPLQCLARCCCVLSVVLGFSLGRSPRTRRLRRSRRCAYFGW